MELLSPPGLPQAETASPIAKAQKSPVSVFGLVDMRVLVRVDVEKCDRKKTTSVCMNEECGPKGCIAVGYLWAKPIYGCKMGLI